MSAKTRPFIYLLIIILVVAVGVGVFFGITLRRKEISVTSFDGAVTLSFGEYRVSNLSYGWRKQEVSFTNKENSFLSFIENHENLVATYASPNNDAKNYLLLKDGYWFDVRIHSSQIVTIHNTICEIVTKGAGKAFAPLPNISNTLQVYFIDDELDNFWPWQAFVFFEDFESLAKLYEGVSSDYLLNIDKENKTIELAYYNFVYMQSEEIRSDKKLVLMCSDEGIQFSWEDKQ